VTVVVGVAEGVFVVDEVNVPVPEKEIDTEVDDVCDGS